MRLVVLICGYLLTWVCEYSVMQAGGSFVLAQEPRMNETSFLMLMTQTYMFVASAVG